MRNHGSSKEQNEQKCHKAGNLLATFEHRMAIAAFRKSNEIQKNARDPKVIPFEHARFFTQSAKLLDEAEALLDQNATEEARGLFSRYIQEKMAAGLYRPIAI